jgi:hypothetical protein
MKRKRTIALSIIVLLALTLFGFVLYGASVPGNVHSLLKTGSYTKMVGGGDLFAGSGSSHQYTVDGNFFTATGDSPFFVVDVSNEPPFDFVRVKISNLQGRAWGEIWYLANADGTTEWETAGNQELRNGVNVFGLPRNSDVRMLRFALSEADNASFNLEYIMFTNNWYVPPKIIALILAVSLAAPLMLCYIAWNIFHGLPPTNSHINAEAIDRHVFGLLCVMTLAIPLAYAVVMTVIKTNTYLDTGRVEQLYIDKYWEKCAPEPHEFQRFILYCV